MGMHDFRQLISSGSPWELTVGYSRAVRVGDRVFVAGTAPQFDDGECPEDPAEQARRCLEIIDTALADAGGSMRRRGAHPHLPRRRRPTSSRSHTCTARRSTTSARPTPPSW